jgi:signal transduction histidine kinase
VTLVTRDRKTTADALTDLLRERTQTALSVILACTALFAVADLGIDARVWAPVYAVKSTLAVFLVVMLWSLRGPTPSQRTLASAFATMNVTFILYLVGDVLKQHFETIPQLAVVVAMSSAAVLPWGVRPQLATAMLIGIGTLWALALSGRPAETLIDPVASVTASLAVSVYVAYEFARFRRDRFDAEAVLAERARHESLRADVRVGTPEAGALKGALSVTADALVRHLGVACACIWTIDDAGRIALGASTGIGAPVDPSSAATPVARIARERRPYLIAPDPDAGTLAFAGHSLVVEDRVLGVVALFSPAPFSTAALDALGSVAETIAFTIERAHAEESRARLLDELERAIRLKSEFVSTMSHELRTPLNVITGYLDMLEDPDWDDPRLALDRIRRANRELLELIEATLDLNRLESGQDRPAIEHVDLRALWAELEEECAALPGARAVRLSWVLANGAALRSDRRKLKTILKNLVGNAVKFTPEGEVVITCREAETSCTVTVRDTGIGIPAEHLPHIFDMFRQVDSTDRRAYGGVGLGLHIVQRLCRQLGGWVRVESVPGQGSTFTVELPRTLDELNATA